MHGMCDNRLNFGRSERARVNVARLVKKNACFTFIHTRGIIIGLNSLRLASIRGGIAGCSKSPRKDSEPSELDNVLERPLSALEKDKNGQNGMLSDEDNKRRGNGGIQLTPLPRTFVFCPLCGRGRGVMKCQKCGGKGVVLTRPGGAGVAGVVGKARCSLCNGVGNVSCLLCGGNES